MMLAAAGAKVALSYLTNKAEAEDVVLRIQKAGGEAAAFQADVSDLEQVDELVASAERYLKQPVTILVNNAGHLIQCCANAEMTEELYCRVIDVNFKSAVFLSKRVIAGMKGAGGGSIVNLTSLAASGIRVNAVSHFINTSAR